MSEGKNPVGDYVLDPSNVSEGTTATGATVSYTYDTLPSKKGHKCCGGCCDVRRAVMVVDSVNICFSFMGLMSVLTMKTLNSSNFDDDEVKTAIEAMDDNMPWILLFIVSIASVLCNAVGIYGAYKYHVGCVGIGLAAYCSYFLIDLLSFNIGGLVYNAFFAYPHFVLIQEMNQGIMTPENYPNEVHSCCCV